MSWRRDFEVAVATLAAKECDREDFLPIRDTDKITVRVNYDDGYDPTYTPGPSSMQLDVCVVRDSVYNYLGKYQDVEFDRFWTRLMRSADE